MKILKCLLMIVTAPVILVLTLFVWLCMGLIYISGLVLGLLSTCLLYTSILYNQMLLSEKLYPHLLEIDETAQSRLEQMLSLIHISVRYDRSAQVISWESAAERIGELLESGQFASNVELTEAAGYERSLLSEKLWHLYHDFSEEAREAGYLSCLSEIKGNGFPEETRRLTEQLSDPAFLSLIHISSGRQCGRLSLLELVWL